MAFGNTWQPSELPQTEARLRLAATVAGTYLYVFSGVVDGVPVAENLSYQALYSIARPVIRVGHLGPHATD